MRSQLTTTIIAIIIASCGIGLANGNTRYGWDGKRSGNYLIITAPDYVSSAPLNQFVAAKSAQGFNVSVYEVPSGTSRTAIRDYILDLWMTEDAPDYILIIGDTDGATSSNNTIPHWVGSGTRNGTTDLYYACMDAGDDWIPEIHIGRFSVRTIAHLQNIVDKTLRVESGNYPDPDYVKRAAFLATDDSTAQANQTHDYVIENYIEPNDGVGIRIYANQGGGTTDITNAVNNGALFVVYFGHSSSSGWWTPSFNQSNVNQLTNEGLYGLAMGWSCNTAHFDYDECFGETWIRKANAGAAAYLSASNYIWWGSVENWESSRRMEKNFFFAFSRGNREISKAWREACMLIYNDPDFGPDHEHTRNIFEEFVILGDPSLYLPEGVGFSLAVAPGEYEVCAPLTNQVQFDVTVGLMGEFSEVVNLSVGNLPTGATAAFTTNDQAPPFTSVLTISGLQNVSDGIHDFQVLGTATSFNRSSELTLKINSFAPSAVTLVSPSDNTGDAGLSPTFTWQEIPGSAGYELELATDVNFDNVIYSATTANTSHQIQNPLNMLTRYYWRVRAENACGLGEFSIPFSFVTIAVVAPVSYDMQNGQTGTYSYFDDIYDGNGDNTQPLAWLTGGLGELTDGVIATQHWNTNNAPYVGWSSLDPTITFHFAQSVNIESVVLHMDDSSGGGGVHVPTDVRITMGDTTITFPCTDPPGDATVAIACDELGMSGETMEIVISDYSSGGYMMLSEVEFFGTPNVGACCTDEGCVVDTEDACTTIGGTYMGDAIACDPDPCGQEQPPCLFLSEVVFGTLSGGCPRWIEIVNSGTIDYTFKAGGLIIQEGSSSDVIVDVDLTGQTIPAGGTFVVVATDSGACSGAFQAIYGIQPDLQTTHTFGDGTARFMITDKANGSNILDIYGEFGVDGTGTNWAYTDGYATRLPDYNEGVGQTFVESEWYCAGVGSLDGEFPEELLLDLTSPGYHMFYALCRAGEVLGDVNADQVVDLQDYGYFYEMCLAGPAEDFSPTCGPVDMDNDMDVDLNDFYLFAPRLNP